MRASHLTLCTFLMLTSLALAQGKPPVPAELAKFDRLIGNWEGSGTTMMGPDGPDAPWTATSTVKKVMDGFFIQEDVVIDLGDLMPMPIVFRTLYGYDQQTQKYMTMSVGNMGAPTATQIHWVDDNTMVTVEEAIENGQFTQIRWITKFEKDGTSFTGHRSTAADPTHPYITGRMTRAKAPATHTPLGEVVSAAPASPEMARLSRMAGKYRLDGWYRPMAEMEPMTIGGIETYSSILGGGILEMSVVGDDNPAIGVYKAWGAFGYNSWKNCYTAIHVNNMGEMGGMEARYVDDQLVFTHSTLRMGAPSLSRSVYSLDAKGKLTKVSVHGLTGTGAPMHEFEATYKLQK